MPTILVLEIADSSPSQRRSKHSPSLNRPKSAAGAFIGVILLPIVGNAAEHATAVTVAAKGKMDTWCLKSGSGEEFDSERCLLWVRWPKTESVLPSIIGRK